MPPSRRDLDKLVSGAGSEIADEAPLRRGRGINGMLTETPAPAAPPPAAAPAPAPPVAPPTPAPVDNPTSPHVDNTTRLPAEEPPPPPGPPAAPKAQPARKVASYRIDPDLARRVKIYAAMHDLNDYEVVEAALTAWLDSRDTHRADR